MGSCAALAAWMLSTWSEGPAGTTISTFDATDRKAIQTELDRQTRESMMTVTVSPVCELSENGTLSFRVINDPENKMAQSFTIEQDGNTLFKSERLSPGEEISSCTPQGARAGEATIAVQGLDATDGQPFGNPAAVEVTIIDAAANRKSPEAEKE